MFSFLDTLAHICCSFLPRDDYHCHRDQWSLSIRFDLYFPRGLSIEGFLCIYCFLTILHSKTLLSSLFGWFIPLVDFFFISSCILLCIMFILDTIFWFACSIKDIIPLSPIFQFDDKTLHTILVAFILNVIYLLYFQNTVLIFHCRLWFNYVVTECIVYIILYWIAFLFCTKVIKKFQILSVLLFPPLLIEPQFHVCQLSYLLKFTETFAYFDFS